MHTLLRGSLYAIAALGLHLTTTQITAADTGPTPATELAQSSHMDLAWKTDRMRSPARTGYLKLAQDDPDDYVDEEEYVEPGDPAAIIGEIITGVISEQHRRKCERWADRCDDGDFRACRRYEHRCGGIY